MPSLRARRRSHDETAAMSSRNTMVVSAGSNIILARNEYPFRLRRGQSLAFNEPQQRRSDNRALLFSLIEGQDLVCVALDVPGIVLLEAEKMEVSDLPDDLRLEASKYASSVIGTDQAVSKLAAIDRETRGHDLARERHFPPVASIHRNVHDAIIVGR